jgi:uncharacterized radical SAM protein YgiQ
LASPLPVSLVECDGQPPDVVLVTGDAAVDHPAFGAAVIARWLLAHGFSVGLIAQPDLANPDAFCVLGRPRLFFGVTAGNLDSMVAARTSSGRPRSDDAFSPGGRPGRRPDRATIPYTTRLRQAFPGVPVVLGGVEASLRRFAHLDWWQGAMRRSILADSKADLLVYGMGELAALAIARRLAEGLTIRDCGDIAGTARLLGRTEDQPSGPVVELPSFAAIVADARALGRATLLALDASRPFSDRPTVQMQGDRLLWCNPPSRPLSTEEFDRLNELPYTRAPHPSIAEEGVPALESVRGSVIGTRGCGGGCAFCSIALHQGRHVVSRSAESILREVRSLVRMPGWTGTITDIGGPTANLWGLGCGSESAARACHRPSCLHPRRCTQFSTDHGPFADLLSRVAAEPGVKHVFVGSGLRHDLAVDETRFLAQVVARHASGRLTVAPEHVHAGVLRLMRKPGPEVFDRFLEAFEESVDRAGSRTVLVPYFVAALPGSTPEAAVELASYMKKRHIRPRQVQLFLPTPGTLATAMWASGEDPETGEAVYVARSARERDYQRALLLAWKQEEAPMVREALRAWGRADLIGFGPDCLVAPGPERAPSSGGSPKQGSQRPTGSRKGG